MLIVTVKNEKWCNALAKRKEKMHFTKNEGNTRIKENSRVHSLQNGNSKMNSSIEPNVVNFFSLLQNLSYGRKKFLIYFTL
jgi:hypothetical protein